MSQYDPITQQALDASTSKQPEYDPITQEALESANNNPSDITKATSSNLPVNPNTGSADYNGWCQAFVEQVTNNPQKFPSAIDAWNNYSQTGQAQQGTKGLQPGDVVYFSPNDSNQGYGHTGIFAGKEKFISATDNGVETNNLTDWEKQTGQQVLGYIKNPENLPHIGGIQ